MAISTTTVECSTSPSMISPNIKNENHRDDRAKVEKPIAFSITNILSNNFGNNKVLSENKNGFVFRPYDSDCGQSSPKKIKLDKRSDDEDSNGEWFLSLVSF